ncbi:MAG: hypothetical protein EXS64_08725 [Candidatus Latescibacteria bacterium]|nr:hypothetical protein [Candidatus Latescibacterota bacterium]
MEHPKQPDFSEDDAILAQLTDPEDAEAFSNLMENAHGLGQSAASFVREEPGRTSRRAIRRLCVKDRRRTVADRVRSVLKSMWKTER